MTPEQLQFHKQEIAKLSANGWIGPTYSPICAPTMLVDKRSDGTGERKMRMVVKYQELNALTIAPDFPLPPIQTILEMLGGAQYFFTLSLESGFHQIRMAKEDRWKTAFRSAMGLFEYKQFYPKFSKCKFAKRELTYLGYTISAEGIKPAADKIQAIKAWPEVLENETQIRQFLGTVGYCRMFMGPDFAKAVIPVQQKYSIYDQELLALVAALEKRAHLLRATKVTAHADNQALTHLQQLKASKPLRGRTARWLDFLAEFPDLTITYLPGARNQVADALSHLPCHPIPCHQPSPIDLPETPLGSLAALGLATDPSDPPHKTRGTRTDYRQLSGLRRRSSRKRLPSQPVTHPPTAPNPAPESPTPTAPQQTSTSPVLDWPPAYSKCPVFSEPYHTASTKPGEAVQLELQHRLHTFRFVLPYLHICVNGLWLICVPHFPEFLTHVLYTHHDHVTAGHRGQKKTYTALSKHHYWPGVRTYTNAKMAHFIPAKKSHSAADTVELLGDRLIRYHGFPDVLISGSDPRF
ncbi:OSJNBa0079C19.6 protein, related [Eimeria brunetti]|uniref:OSJNBa0079C19.6 protein, related n=1 Tax=Eimeria brunetti TaxID=51314 RepID=U6LG21_9EIME|nr:OSJNBa0079C19.6 protein, related [Eimeria brunetti]